MAFNPITNTEIESGKPVTSTTANKVQDNFDDHEARLQDLEAGSAVAYPPIIMRLNGPYGNLITRNNLLKTMPNFNLTILGVRLFIETAGSAGSTEVMIRRVRAGVSNNVLSSGLSVLFSTGNNYLSPNASFNPSYVDIDAGDLIILDLTSLQTNADTFFVRIDYEKRA